MPKTRDSHSGRAGKTCSDRDAKAFMREAEDPVRLLRSLRRLLSLCGRSVDSVEWQKACIDVLLRCHALDPAWESMTEEEMQSFKGDSPIGDKDYGVKQLAMEALSPDDQYLASRMGEIREAMHQILPGRKLTTARADHLARITDDYHLMLADASIPLAPQEQRIWDLLLSQPEDKPLETSVILARLRTSGGTISESNAKKSLRGPLKRKGVRNRKRAGYFIPVEFRPEDATTK